ncbi:hypothetical protein ACNVED_08035 [Legionella sp. D16C41]|uniref:hypothetical protein n=1 Tax=Legionella sp. D16C41 TaxID=3402688 RepID=UPI003AF70502
MESKIQLPFSPRLQMKKLKAQASEKHQLMLENFKEIQTVGYPEYKILKGISAETTEICTCCVFILYSKSNPNYFFGHFNSVNYSINSIERNLFKDDFKEILEFLASKGLSITCYEAIIVGGDKSFFNEIKKYLLSLEVKIVASYCDNYQELELDDSLKSKDIIFDHTTHKVTIFSAGFPRQVLTLSNLHQTFEGDFFKKKRRLEELSQKLITYDSDDPIQEEALTGQTMPDDTDISSDEEHLIKSIKTSTDDVADDADNSTEEEEDLAPKSVPDR